MNAQPKPPNRMPEDERMIRGMAAFGDDEKFLGLFPVTWRYDLTARFPGLRKVLRSRWTSFLLQIAGFAFFMPALMAGWIGSSVGNANLIIVLVWIFWWSALMLLMVPFASRIWCAICPLPSLGEWLSRKTFIVKPGGKPLTLGKKWPAALRNMWPVNFVFLALALFSGILTTKPIVTAAMLTGMVLVSLGTALIYEKRTFCRYLCPVGGFLGLYSNFSTMEIRSNPYSECRGHKQKECVVGTAEAYACPWMEAPTTMSRNTYCGMCLECFRTCSLDNMSVRLRAPGADLLVDKHRGLDESWKAFIMLGAAGIYSATMMGPWGFLKDWANMKTLSGYLTYVGILGLTVMVVVPALWAAAIWAGRALAGVEMPFRRLFTNLGYSLVPIGLMAWIAFSFAILMPNGSYMIKVISDPMGWGWDLFGTAGFPWTPFGLRVMPYLQVSCLLFGLAYSADVVWKLARQTYGDKRPAALAAIPPVVFLTGVTALFTWLFVG
ncbi:MAG TPA: 4Fe-4S binding protein [Symbiobacteriaceae bacterium]|jgi:polyferredoxin